MKRLLILDLNGILIHRIYKKDYIKYQKLFQNEFNNFTLTQPRFKGNFCIWFRPNVQQFISWCLEHFNVAIWSSVQKHNMEPLLETLLPTEDDRSKLLFWWHQENCLMEENSNKNEAGKQSTSFYKVLDEVWKRVDLEEKWLIEQPGENWRQQTLMIDDNKTKVRDNPQFTSIHPRTWKLFDIIESTGDESAKLKIYDDHTLEDDGPLKKWLQQLLEWKGSVPEYVEQHPYVDPPIKEKTTDWDDD
ncbi:unnamed protein product [Didymodactylos carnosus]|uniref:Mitochondrial import inner membrane translocase subunit TIM50 n=1 Tax=Didymodactylos carnosus TaxID=1234261 RepID=A0A814T6X5_9BILA|nr:unnamed protein product [Didymodactylos carnosus]CAF1562540.1 unnamed protein product [Didymodactylos carnosus]CAF3917778.1 unnamed protein product [Didymodactylos carnosus]CAF4354715.1 unnamed protein product [Didymodactylos carnosus]